MPALQHILDRLGEIMSTGEFVQLFPHIAFQVLDERTTGALSDRETFFRAFTFDVAFDCKEGINAAHDLNSDRGERDLFLARSHATCVLL